MPEVERRLGTLRARRVQLGNHSIFPNGILGFRLALPRGPLKTEFWHFVLLERDAPEELKRAIRIGSQANNGAAGMFEQDDVDNWRQVTESSMSRFAQPSSPGSVDGRGARGHRIRIIRDWSPNGTSRRTTSACSTSAGSSS